MVARTEGGRAFIEGSKASAKDSGYTHKRVMVTMGCDDCFAYEAEGEIPINESFSGGEIPFHPNCMCYYVYSMRGGQELSEYWTDEPWTDEEWSEFWEE